MQDLSNLENSLAPIFEQLRNVPPPSDVKRATARRAVLIQASDYRDVQAAPRQPLFAWRKPLQAAAILVLVVGTTLITGGGVARAADRAVPGDALYGLDTALESAQLRLATSPEQALALRLAHTEERLQEAEQLARAGDTTHLAAALSAYGATVAHLGQAGTTLQNDETLNDLINTELSRHEARLQQIAAQVPEQAQPGIERALQNATRNQNRVLQQTQDSPPEDAGPPENVPGNAPDDAGPPDDVPGKAPGDTRSPDSMSDSNPSDPPTPTPGPPEDAGPPDHPGQGQGPDESPGNNENNGNRGNNEGNDNPGERRGDGANGGRGNRP